MKKQFNEWLFKEYGLEKQQIESCLADQGYTPEEIEKDMEVRYAFFLSGTPAVEQKIEPTPKVVFRTKGVMKVSEFRQAMKELVEDYKVSPNFEIDPLFLAKAIVSGGR